MKKYFVLLITFVTAVAAAQDFRGIAVYETKVVFKFQRDNKFEAEQDELIRKAMEKKFTLKFNGFQSLYEEEEQLAQPSSGGMIFTVNSGTLDGPFFKDIKEKQYSIATDIYDKDFLIVDSLKQFSWEMTGETKKIGDYTCYRATCVRKAKPGHEEKAINLTGGAPKEGEIISVWYTPDIPVSHGPGEYWGLPGLILEVNDGPSTLLCTKLILNPDKKFEVRAPKRGQKVTRAEYDAIKLKKDNERN